MTVKRIVDQNRLYQIALKKGMYEYNFKKINEKQKTYSDLVACYNMGLIPYRFAKQMFPRTIKKPHNK